MAANPITPLQFRGGDIATDTPVVLQNLNTFIRQVQTVAGTAVAAPSWVHVTGFVNGWGAFGTFKVQYAQLPDTRVIFDGALASGTITSPAFFLPKTLWPSQDKNFPVESNGAYGKLVIRAVDGAVVPQVGSNVFFSLDGVGFYPGS